ncbi:hypothetical protein DFH07DRAFT_768595 [Mycena maculata]|uniref:Uncharacterized protein n=1 Tax=Mycena maculata TaxID=230809 RepID=A0AAD7JSQ1_9AGAR|nr:hypothetical protein DFH07DRAFT_768595 [Mycena maculata]
MDNSSSEYPTPLPTVKFSAFYFAELTFQAASQAEYPPIYGPKTISQWTFTDEVPSTASSHIVEAQEAVPHIDDLTPILKEMEAAFHHGSRSVAVTLTIPGATVHSIYSFTKFINNNKVAVQSINKIIGGPKKTNLQLFNSLNERTEDQSMNDMIRVCQSARRQHDSNLESLFCGPLAILHERAGPYALQIIYKQMQLSLFYETEVVQLPNEVRSWWLIQQVTRRGLIIHHLLRIQHTSRGSVHYLAILPMDATFATAVCRSIWAFPAGITSVLGLTFNAYHSTFLSFGHGKSSYFQSDRTEDDTIWCRWYQNPEFATESTPRFAGLMNSLLGSLNSKL